MQDKPRRPLGIDHQEEQEQFAQLRIGNSRTASETPIIPALTQTADVENTTEGVEPVTNA